jgi:hypothetical protein
MNRNDLHPTRRALLGAAGGMVFTSGLAAADTRPPESEPNRGGTMTIMFFAEPPSLVSLVSTSSLTCSDKVIAAG